MRIGIVFVAALVASSPVMARGLVVVQTPNSGVIYGSNGPRDGCHGGACWYHHTMTYLQVGKHYTPPQGFQHVTPPGFDASDGCTESNVYCIPSQFCDLRDPDCMPTGVGQ